MSAAVTSSFLSESAGRFGLIGGKLEAFLSITTRPVDIADPRHRQFDYRPPVAAPARDLVFAGDQNQHRTTVLQRIGRGSRVLPAAWAHSLPQIHGLVRPVLAGKQLAVWPSSPMPSSTMSNGIAGLIRARYSVAAALAPSSAGIGKCFPTFSGEAGRDYRPAVALRVIGRYAAFVAVVEVQRFQF